MAFCSPRKVAIQDTKGKPGVSKPRASTHHKQGAVAVMRLRLASQHRATRKARVQLIKPPRSLTRSALAVALIPG